MLAPFVLEPQPVVLGDKNDPRQLFKGIGMSEDELEKEYELIQQKKSTLSSLQRQRIVREYKKNKGM